MSGPTETHYELRVVRYQYVQDEGEAPDLYVKIVVQNRPQRTPTIRKSRSPEWNYTFAFSSSGASDVVEVHVKRTSRRWRHDRFIGSLSVSISSLLEECACGEAKWTLHSPSNEGVAPTADEITMYLKDVDAERRAGIDIENVRQGIERLSVSAEREDHPVSRIADAVRKLDEVVKAVDGAAKVNSYLNLTWQSLTVIYRIVSHQFKKDKKVIDLVQLMKETFDFAADAGTLTDKTKKIKEGFKVVLEVTLDCCRFISEYAGRRFAERVIRLDDHIIFDYTDKFKSVKAQMDSHTQLHIAKGIDYMESEHRLQKLKERLSPIKSDDTSKLPRCLPGTRVQYLEEIRSWLFGDASENILWLRGIAGAGKSTIAATIMDHCDRERCLAALLFFRRGNDDSGSIIRSIAYQLAAFHPAIAGRIAAHVEAQTNAKGATLSDQFKELLLEPSKKSRDVLNGPVVIILDALDECGDESQRRDILDLLMLEFNKLPLSLRFLVTSRPENDIMKKLSSQAHIRDLVLDHDSHDGCRDVLAYIREELQSLGKGLPGGEAFWKELQPIGENLPDEQAFISIAENLSAAANGLFIWASTAMKMVRESDDHQEELRILVSGIQSRSVGEYGIDTLYETVLNTSGISWKKEASRSRFVKVLGLIISAKEALSDEAIDGLLDLKPGKAKLTLERLRSVLSYETGMPIRLHHASFFDYLTSPERSGGKYWHIDEASAKRAIAERCFDVMAKGLHFNICGLESSFVRNKDVPDLEERIKRNIPRCLEYACRFWAQHLCDLSTSVDKTALLDKLKSFTYKRLFLWFEVLSLTNHFRNAEGALTDASVWVKTIDADAASFLQDASKLAFAFTYAISESAPHLYLSALSLSKFDYCVAEHYSTMHPTVSVSMHEAGGSGSGPRRETPDHRLDNVRSVSFSPDGRRVASASGSTVSVWVVDSGELGAVLTGHADHVTSVVFLPDGKRVVSSSWDETVRIWDIDTREHVVLGSDMSSVAISADGKLVLVATTEVNTDSDDPPGTGTYYVRIWDLDSGDLIGTLDTGSDSPHIAISPNGRLVASTYADTEVRIWNVDSGKFVADPLERHTLWVTSLAFSPDGGRVISASEDATLRMWDAFTGNLVAGPFIGHTDLLYSVVFSPDGNYVASSSGDRSIRIWNAKTAQRAAGPFYGHARLPVTSVAWSSDGTRIASRSYDGTVCIWDAKKLLVTQDAIVNRTEDAGPASNSPSNWATLSQSTSSQLNTIANWTLSEDGWVLGERGELLLWCPWEIRKTLWLPQTIAVMGVPYGTRLDLTNYSDVLGKTWQTLPGYREAHDECSTVSSGPPTESAKSAHQENVAMVSITARRVPIKLFD